MRSDSKWHPGIRGTKLSPSTGSAEEEAAGDSDNAIFVNGSEEIMASGAKTSKKQRANFIGFMRKKVEQKRKRADFWKKYAEKHTKKD